MDIKGGFMSGFLVLGFVIFIAGLLTGMLAIALMQVKPDFSALGFTVFTLGFVAGMVTITLVLVILKFVELTRKSS